MDLTLTLDLSKLTLPELAAVVTASYKPQLLVEYFDKRKREQDALRRRTATPLASKVLSPPEDEGAA